MRRLPLAVLVLLPLGCAGPALAADAVTYKGTLGTLPIILELAMPTAGGERPYARYAYLSKGTDIPLDGLPVTAGVLRLKEEAPCTQETCVPGEDGTVAAPPIGADWTLTQDGARLSGTWKDSKSGKTLPIRLERRAERTIDTSSLAPLQALLPQNGPGAAATPPLLTPEALPYDFLKLDWPRVAGEETKVGAVVMRMETDKRTGVAYPVVETLGGPDAGPVNAYLLQGRLQAELPSFSCRSQAYAGFGWWPFYPATSGSEDDASGTAEEGPDAPNVTLEHVSPRLIGFSESNSFWCGGAHPNNYTNHTMADAETGDGIVPETLLAGWVARGRDGTAVDPATYNNSDESLTLGPSDELVAYVRSRRVKLDEDTEASCGFDDFLADPYHFGVYVTQGDLVFTLRDLPHVIFACTEDLLTVPLADARPLLTEKAAGYFAVLDK